MATVSDVEPPRTTRAAAGSSAIEKPAWGAPPPLPCADTGVAAASARRGGATGAGAAVTAGPVARDVVNAEDALAAEREAGRGRPGEEGRAREPDAAGWPGSALPCTSGASGRIMPAGYHVGPRRTQGHDGAGGHALGDEALSTCCARSFHSEYATDRARRTGAFRNRRIDRATASTSSRGAIG